MKLLDSIAVSTSSGVRRIELLHGDLAAIPSEHEVDVLIVSAFPNDYIATSTSLIGALQRRGLSVRALAHSKHVDLRSTCSCWLSSKIDNAGLQLNFDRILCFEPLARGDPPSLVGDIFRALTPFTGGDPPLESVAMPILAAGDQGWPISLVLPPLIDAAYHWLLLGLPIKVIKIVAFGEASASEAASEFQSAKTRYASKDLQRPERKYDVFVSYSHADQAAGLSARDHLQRRDLRVFFDEQSIDRGASWQQKIFEALDSCHRVIAIYSPSYTESKVCQEEFNIAWARRRNEDDAIVYPVYWKSTDLPTHMKLLNYIDCREEDLDRLQEACDKVGPFD